MTIADVASAAGVSKTAVSFAFNNPDQLGNATLERIRSVAGDLGYTPLPAARSLSTKRSGSIGLLVPNPLPVVFGNPFVAELIQGIGEVCEQDDLTLLLVPPLNGSTEGAIRQAGVDGFISLGLAAGDRSLATLLRLQIPYVLVDADGADGPSVSVDDEGGAEAAARHLVELGHREIGIVALGPVGEGGPTGVVARRLRGYLRAIRSAGLPEPVTVDAMATFQGGSAAFTAHRSASRRPTAVLAMSDIVAVGVMSAARSAGLHLPDDLSIVGYDDLAIAAWTFPSLTTVRQPIAEKGRQAARMLIARIQGRSPKVLEPLATRLIVRESTAKPKGVVA